VFIPVILTVVILLGGIIFNTSPAEAKKPKVLRFVVPTPEGDWPLTHMTKEFAKRFNDRAKGEYVIEVHAGGALAKLPEYFDAVRIGAVDGAFCNWGMFSFIDPRLGLLETPFLFTNNYATSEACKQLLPLYDQILQEKFNAKGLGMVNTGGLGLHSQKPILHSQKPIKTLKDWDGLLVGAVSPVTSTLVKGLGGSAVTIVFTDLYESLQKKVVDAAVQSSHGGVVFGFPDICKHFTAFFGIPAPAGYSINLDIWKKMPSTIQQILIEEAKQSGEWMSDVLVGPLPKGDLDAFKKKGVSVYYLPKAERDRWAKEFEKSNKELFSEFGELGKKIMEIADDVNKQYPYSEDGIL
jgi:TRAP-type C4-dicarboxylate transport system substrate-binding protein